MGFPILARWNLYTRLALIGQMHQEHHISASPVSFRSISNWSRCNRTALYQIYKANFWISVRSLANPYYMNIPPWWWHETFSVLLILCERKSTGPVTRGFPWRSVSNAEIGLFLVSLNKSWVVDNLRHINARVTSRWCDMVSNNFRNLTGYSQLLMNCCNIAISTSTEWGCH